MEWIRSARLEGHVKGRTQKIAREDWAAALKSHRELSSGECGWLAAEAEHDGVELIYWRKNSWKIDLARGADTRAMKNLTIFYLFRLC